jgi:hypothetical protein
MAAADEAPQQQQQARQQVPHEAVVLAEQIHQVLQEAQSAQAWFKRKYV